MSGLTQEPPRRGTLDKRPIAVRQTFHAKSEFDEFFVRHKELCEDRIERKIVDHCTLYGIRNFFFGFIPPEDVALIGKEPREHLLGRGLNSRQRVLLDMVLARSASPANTRIYGHEAVTPFALALRGRFPKFLGTEYAPGFDRQRELFPIQHSDICRSTFPDASFDIVVSGDVFEHVYDIDMALSDTARILRPGGTFLGTFPFLSHSATSSRRARINNSGQIEHLLLPPIFHGDPLDPSGCLVFELPGWDILERALAAGFSDATIEFICDQERGITASWEGESLRPRGIFVAHFVK